MAVGVYKSGVAIIVTYQAVGVGTGKTIQMNVYDEAYALDAGQSGAMAEVVATGRYYKVFTPDAEGEWIITMNNTTDGGGDVVKAFAVAGHDVDSIGDAVATIAGYITEAGATEAKQDIIDTNVDDIETLLGVVDGKIDTIDGEIATIDTEVGNNTTAIGIIDGLHDVAGEDGAGDTTIRDVIGKKTDTVAGDSLIALNKINKAAIDVIDGEISTIDTEVGNNTAAIGVIDAFHDVPGEDVGDDTVMSDVIGKKTDTVAGTSIIALAKQLLADTGTTGSIRGADDDTLKSLSDQIDGVSAPAMVG